MNILWLSQASELQWRANVKAMNGYESFTTFWSDFTIADLCGGKHAVNDTFNRAFKEWKNDVKYLAELTLVLNHKIWEHYNNGNHDLAKVYDNLWKKASDYGYSHFKGKELDYFYHVLD